MTFPKGYYPDFGEFKKMAKTGNLIPVYKEILADTETPVSAFMKLNRTEHCFLLESVEGGQRLARYSFIGTEPYSVLSTRGEDNTNPLPLIAGELNKYKIVPVSGLPRFCGGAVGYLAYESGDYDEAKQRIEQSLAIFRTLGDARETMRTISYLSLVYSSQGQTEQMERLIQETSAIQEGTDSRDSFPWGLLISGRVLCELGRYPEASSLMEESIEVLNDLGIDTARIDGLYPLSEPLADAKMHLGRYAAA